MNNLIVYLIISAVIGLIDTLPLYYRRRPWRYRLTVFLQAVTICLTLFYARIDGLAWWIEGPAIGIMLYLPALSAPAPRGAYKWYGAIANFAMTGLAAAAIEFYLPGIASWLS